MQSKTALEETERRSEQFKQEVNALKVALKDTKEERDALKEAKATVCTKLEVQASLQYACMHPCCVHDCNCVSLLCVFVCDTMNCRGACTHAWQFNCIHTYI